VPVTGGSSRPLVGFDDPTRRHTRIGFTTDGKTFYFIVGANQSDIWVAQLKTRGAPTKMAGALGPAIDPPRFEPEGAQRPEADARKQRPGDFSPGIAPPGLEPGLS